VDRQRGKPFGGVVVQPWLGRTSPFCLQYDSLNLVDMYGIRVGNEASVDSPDILQESGIRGSIYARNQQGIIPGRINVEIP